MRLEKADRETDSALSKEAQIKQQNDNINKKNRAPTTNYIYAIPYATVGKEELIQSQPLSFYFLHIGILVAEHSVVCC